MKLILISLPEKINTDSETDLLIKFFESGLSVFHLRKPALSKEETIHFLSKIPSDHLKKIVLHHHHTIAQDIGLKGIHLPEHLRNSYLNQEIETIKHKFTDSTLSTSFHETKNLKLHNLSFFHYCFLSPVFPSISKQGYQGNLLKDDIKENLATLKTSNIQTEIFALGGINAEKIGIVKSLGFDGIGVLGAVWHSSHPLKTLEALLIECDKT